MSILEYVDKYGKYSFSDLEFNEVDNVILSALSYLNLGGIVSSKFKGKRTISEVANAYFKIYSSQDKNIMAVRNALSILKSISEKRRYKDILMYGYSYIGDDEQQFSAVSMDISENITYISFEGTDQLLSGWEEDFKMAYQFPVLSQKQAIDYVNRNFLFSRKRLILGGHSKGGNLAMVASMYCNFLVRRKIILIYNNDGPGLRKEQIKSSNYERIASKLVHIVPNYSIVGLLLGHTDKYEVILSNRKSIFAHAVVTWVVEGNRFKRSELSSVSMVMDESMTRWLDKYDDKEREEIVTSLFDIFRQAEVNNLLEIMDNKKIILKLIKESAVIDPKVRRMLLEFVSIFFDYFKDYEVEKIKNVF